MLGLNPFFLMKLLKMSKSWISPPNAVNLQQFFCGGLESSSSAPLPGFSGDI
jgi:hypothetical protein